MDGGRRIGLFVGAMLSGSVALGAVSVVRFGIHPPTPVPPAVVVALVALLATAEYLLVRYTWRGEINALNLFEAALAPTLLALPGAFVIVAVGIAQSAAAVARKNDPLKASFNVAQWMVAAGAGSLVFQAMRTGNGLTVNTNDVTALVCALIVVTVVNQSAFTYVLHLVQRRPVRQVLAGLKPVILPGWVGGWAVNTAFGLLFVGAYLASRATVLLFFVPLLMLHWASRGFATARVDRVRMSGLQRATHVLGLPLDPREALPRFLMEVVDCFESEAADLVLLQGDTRVVHRLIAGERREFTTTTESLDTATLAAAMLANGETAHVDAGYPDVVAASLLREEGWRDCIVAPVRSGDAVVGVLCSYNRGGLEGFEQGERAILEALAGEVAGAVERSELVVAMLEERGKLSRIVESTSDGIVTLAADGTILSWNHGFEDISGYDAADMVGTHRFAELRAWDADEADVFLERWAGAELPSRVQILTAAGAQRWLSCSYTTAINDRDERELIVVARDATRTHEMERMKDDFISTVSHELRTPLTPIKGSAVTLLEAGDRVPAATRKEALESILRQAERLERLIVNLLEVSRIEHDAVDHRREPVDVATLALRVVDDFRVSSPNRPIVVELQEQHCAVVGHAVWIEQVLSNLLSNAVKYAPGDEPITVGVAIRGDQVEISVADRGPGIPDGDAERVFGRFERLNDRGTQAGTGLGLYIARQLAHAMDGTLHYRPAPGGGACFVLNLPAMGRLVAVS